MNNKIKTHKEVDDPIYENTKLERELEALRSTKMTEEQFQRFLKIIAKAGVTGEVT